MKIYFGERVLELCTTQSAATGDEELDEEQALGPALIRET